jgi:hypothetical protein
MEGPGAQDIIAKLTAAQKSALAKMAEPPSEHMNAKTQKNF